MADSAQITTNIEDGASITGSTVEGAVITSSVNESTSVVASVTTGAKGDKGDKGDVGTTDYNELVNTPDLTLKADQATTYTKIEVDTSLAGKAELVHVHAISDVTGLQTALDGKSATGHTHTAANVTDFDTEVSNNTDVATNTAARHTHANKTLLDTYSQTEVNLADAVAKKHTHTNSAVLDATTASFTTADETKLDGIAAGAQVNTVTSVNTRTGAVTGLAEASDLTAHTGNTSNPHSVTKAQVGLGNADNTSDANKPLSTATQTALNGKFTQRTITGTANQVTVTNGDGVSGNPTLSLPSAITTPGSITITGNNSPQADSTYTNGTSSLYWSNTYTDRLYLNATAYLDGATAGVLGVAGRFEFAANTDLLITQGGTRNLIVDGSLVNTALGTGALNLTTTGTDNVAIGTYALISNSTGSRNVGLGTDALNGNLGGTNNMGIGRQALYKNTSGSSSVGVGVGALYGNTTGGANIGIGENAGRWITGGATLNETTGNSIYIGVATKASANGNTNETVIGYNLTGNGSNTVTIGNSSITANYFSGNIESTTTSAGVILKSPDGTRYRLTVANGGTLTITAA